MDLFCSANFIQRMKSRKIRWVEHVARMKETRNATAFGWEIYRKETTGKIRRKCEGNIKVDFK
jgi:hypothetical protein